MKHSIMVVDDSRIVFTEMKKMLDGTDIEIVSYCRSGEEALEEYENVKPELVTMDVVMPGIDGLETTEELIKRWPEAKVVMVSSLAYDDIIDKACATGAKSFIFKPFDKENLIKQIEAILKA